MHLNISTHPSERVEVDVLKSYELAYHEFNITLSDDIKFRIRDLIFAIADPCCPLHYYKDNRIGVNTISYLIGETGAKKEKASGGVREELFRRCARLGLIEPAKKNLQIKLRIPGPVDFEEITRVRLDLELNTFLAIHRMECTEKRDAIDKLAYANDIIPQINPSIFTSSEIATKLKCDPEFGHKAEVFWKKDAKFHTLHSMKTGGKEREDLLWILLERTRLTRSNRATIIARIPESKKEHAAIIKAVAANYVEGASEMKIMEMLKLHTKSSNEAFGMG